MSSTLCRFPHGILPCSLGDCSLLRYWHINSGPSCFRQPDGDGLLRRPCAVLSLPDAIDFTVNKFTCLRRRRLPLSLVSSRSTYCVFFWHNTLVKTLKSRAQLLCLNTVDELR